MTPDELEAIVTGQPEDKYGWVYLPRDKHVTLAFLPDQPMGLSFQPRAVGRSAVIAVLRNLLALPFSIRASLEPEMYRFYCQEIADGAGNFDTPQEQLDWEVSNSRAPRFRNPRHAQSPAEVWPLLHFHTITFRNDAAKTRIFAGVTGEAAWDGEHGIGLYFENGARLVVVTAHPECL